jgi:hypothetical protein
MKKSNWGRTVRPVSRPFGESGVFVEREHTAPHDPQVLEPASMEAEHLGQSLCILEFEMVSLDD